MNSPVDFALLCQACKFIIYMQIYRAARALIKAEPRASSPSPSFDPEPRARARASKNPIFRGAFLLFIAFLNDNFLQRPLKKCKKVS
jgi:hypothetical protein